MKCLLIGGSHDKEVIKIPQSSPIFRIRKKATLLRVDNLFEHNKAQSFEIEEYKRVYLHFAGKEYFVYLLSSIETSELGNILINNYKKLE